MLSKLFILVVFMGKCSYLYHATPPVITPTITGTLGDNGWYTNDVTIS